MSTAYDRSVITPNLFVAASAGIVGLLGLAHLVLTYRGPKLRPRDRSLVQAMDNVAPVITRQTTIWRMWMGFNVSHSMGLLLFGAVYGDLALVHGEILFGSAFLQAVGLATLVGFVVLAKRYWFITPLIGASLATILYILGIANANFG